MFSDKNLLSFFLFSFFLSLFCCWSHSSALCMHSALLQIKIYFLFFFPSHNPLLGALTQCSFKSKLAFFSHIPQLYALCAPSDQFFLFFYLFFFSALWVQYSFRSKPTFKSHSSALFFFFSSFFPALWVQYSFRSKPTLLSHIPLLCFFFFFFFFQLYGFSTPSDQNLHF